MEYYHLIYATAFLNLVFKEKHKYFMTKNTIYQCA